MPLSESWLQVILGVLAVVTAIIGVVRLAVGALAKLASDQISANAQIATAVAEQAARNQEQLLKTQLALTAALDNHFVENRTVLREISTGIAAQTEILRAVVRESKHE